MRQLESSAATLRKVLSTIVPGMLPAAEYAQRVFELRVHERIALRRVSEGRIAMFQGSYFGHGHRVPDYLPAVVESSSNGSWSCSPRQAWTCGAVERAELESLILSTTKLHHRGTDVLNPDRSPNPVPSPFVRRIPKEQAEIEAKRYQRR